MCVHVCVLVCVAPPMVVGAWSMVGALQQLFEYYYYTCALSKMSACSGMYMYMQIICLLACIDLYYFYDEKFF